MKTEPIKYNYPRDTNNRHPKIVSVAVLDINQINMHSLPAPNRHHHVLRAMSAQGIISGKEGFLTDMGTFVDRKVALVYALTNKQVKPKRDEYSYWGHELFSEDLW